MRRRPPLPRWLARWSLLLAALLQFGGAAAGPYWHLPILAAASAVSGEERGDEERERPAPHHNEQACIVCHVVTHTGTLPPEPSLPVPPVAASRETPEHSLPRPLAVRPAIRVRAPPLA